MHVRCRIYFDIYKRKEKNHETKILSQLRARSPLPPDTEGQVYAMPMFRENEKGKQSDHGYDVFCPACKWSGDISPDDEN
jgi:hypothetical protein